MKKRSWIIKTGEIIPFNQYNLDDLIDDNRDTLPSSFVKAIYTSETLQRNMKIGTNRVSKIILREFLDFVYERIVENSDRYIFPDGKSMLYIGVIKDNPNRITKANKKGFMNFATKGRRYGLVLNTAKSGFEHNYYIRTSFRNRQDFSRRIKSGQLYHND